MSRYDLVAWFNCGRDWKKLDKSTGLRKCKLGRGINKIVFELGYLLG